MCIHVYGCIHVCLYIYVPGFIYVTYKGVCMWDVSMNSREVYDGLNGRYLQVVSIGVHGA